MNKMLSAAATVVLAAVPLASMAFPITPVQAMPVFDATNYAQNLLQAARALERMAARLDLVEEQW